MRGSNITTVLGLALTVCRCLLPAPCAAQAVTAEAFFSRPMLTTDRSGLVGAPQPARRMPWIEEYEFRTETRDLVPDRQEYTFRFEPSTPGLHRAQTEFSRTLENQPDLLNDELICEENERRYRDWLALFAIDRELELLDSIVIILSDRQTILNRRVGSLDFDWSSLIEVREDRTDLSARQQKLRYEREEILSIYRIAADELNFADFPGPDDLLSSPTTDLVSDNRRGDLYDLELIERELQLEKAERGRYLNFAQIRYRGPHDEILADRISVGMGLRLSNGGSDRLKVRELEIERDLLEEEMRADVAALNVASSSYRAFHERAVGYYRSRQSLYRAERAELRRLRDVLLQQEVPKVSLVLEVEERSIRNRLALLRLQLSITDDYLDYLDDTDQFCNGLDGNYLRAASYN